jgi:class 3 adenylate cyclase
MNHPHQDNITVMFADVVGSTRLYETLGDAEAQYNISYALTVVGDIVQRHRGKVIKSAGDDVLSAFATVDDAIMAACVIHDTFAENRIFDNLSLSFHIGLHSGPGIFSAGDIYGDTVNVAARLTSAAKSGQIITSKETIEKITGSTGVQVRPFDVIQVKGREQPVEMYDVIWKHTGDETSLIDVTESIYSGQKLVLKLQDHEIELEPETQNFILGRGLDSGLMVPGTMVSRQHASIDYRRNKFILHDLSTNGTYVRVNNEEIFIKREEIPLAGEGIISLGKKVQEQPLLNIYFRCV